MPMLYICYIKGATFCTAFISETQKLSNNPSLALNMLTSLSVTGEETS